MKVAILAGGLGSRLSEETSIRPKPMVEIGGLPILWHIMKIYSSYGFNEFIVMCGYKGEVIKDYFLNFHNMNSDFTIDIASNEIELHKNNIEPWKITICDTGVNTMTGGRIARIKKYVGDETFMLTYGDGVADVHIDKLLQFHRDSKKYATLTAVHPVSRFGNIDVAPDGTVAHFQEKPEDATTWINGGFFVCEPEVFDYIPDTPAAVWEREPLSRLAAEGQLAAFKHTGFWRPMDMLKDKNDLNAMWAHGNAPWKVW